MTEAMRDVARPLDVSTSDDRPVRVVPDAGLRWTPGPDELRLPSCEDEPVSQNTRQIVTIVDSFDILQRHWRKREDVFVGADQFVYWDKTYDGRKNRKNPPQSPDIYVAFHVANRHRSSYVVWEELKPPDFVLEVVSPSSRRRDSVEKPLAYAKMGVPELFLYDPKGRSGPEISGFELCNGLYKPLPEETLREGVVGIRSKTLELCLCIMPSSPAPLDDYLRWYDPAAGAFLSTRHELDEDGRRLAEAKREADARAEASEVRVAELEALIEKIQRG